MRRTLYVLLMMAWAAVQGQTIFPLKISENKRYFVTQEGKPYLYHADTGWGIFTKLTTEEAVEYLSFRKSQGFNTIQTIIAYHPKEVSRYGQKAFDGDADEIDGNNMEEVVKVLDDAERVTDKPVMVIAHTLKGKGISFTENTPAFHNNLMTEKQYEQALFEINQKIEA